MLGVGLRNAGKQPLHGARALSAPLWSTIRHVKQVQSGPCPNDGQTIGSEHRLRSGRPRDVHDVPSRAGCSANALPNEPSCSEDCRRLEGIEHPSNSSTAAIGDITFRMGSNYSSPSETQTNFAMDDTSKKSKSAVRRVMWGRRFLASTVVVSPDVTDRLNMDALAVLAVIRNETQTTGKCTLPVAQLAERANRKGQGACRHQARGEPRTDRHRGNARPEARIQPGRHVPLLNSRARLTFRRSVDGHPTDRPHLLWRCADGHRFVD